MSHPVLSLAFSPVTETFAATTRSPTGRLTSKVTVRPASCRNLPPGSGSDASYWDTECSRIDIKALPGILVGCECLINYKANSRLSS